MFDSLKTKAITDILTVDCLLVMVVLTPVADDTASCNEIADDTITVTSYKKTGVDCGRKNAENVQYVVNTVT